VVSKGKAGFTFGDDVQVVLNGANNQVVVGGILEITGSGQLIVSLGTALEQVVGGNLQQGVMGSHEITVVENSQEVIGNSAARPEGKKITVVAGDFKAETLVGNCNLQATAGEVRADGLAVRLGQALLAVEPLVKGTAFETLFNAFVAYVNGHIHPYPEGTTSAPLTPFAQTMVSGVHTSFKTFTE